MFQQIISIILVLVGAGCAASGGGATSAALNQSPVTVTPTTPGATTTTTTLPPSDPPVTYYSLAQTYAPAWLGGASYTVTGFCAQYNSNTYCWDDGFKTAVSGPTTYSFTYWSIQYQPGGSHLNPCNGTCASGADQDTFIHPLLIDSNVTSAITTAASFSSHTESVNTILTTGTPTTVSCTVSGTTLNCGVFSIDLSQVGL